MCISTVHVPVCWLGRPIFYLIKAQSSDMKRWPVRLPLWRLHHMLSFNIVYLYSNSSTLYTRLTSRWLPPRWMPARRPYKCVGIAKRINYILYFYWVERVSGVYVHMLMVDYCARIFLCATHKRVSICMQCMYGCVKIHIFFILTHTS